MTCTSDKQKRSTRTGFIPDWMEAPCLTVSLGGSSNFLTGLAPAVLSSSHWTTKRSFGRRCDRITNVHWIGLRLTCAVGVAHKLLL